MIHVEEEHMKIKFDIFNKSNNSVTTDKGTIENVSDWIDLLYTAIRLNVITSIQLDTYRVTTQIIKACKFALYKNKPLYLNGEELIYFNQLNKYTQAISDYFQKKEEQEDINACLDIIFSPEYPELLQHYRKGTLKEFIRTWVKEFPQSMTYVDKPCHTTYKGASFDYDYTRRKTVYTVSLLDMLQTYTSEKWCKQHDVPTMQDIHDQEMEAVILPFSACEKSVSNSLYSN
jgi:hypothetical protein